MAKRNNKKRKPPALRPPPLSGLDKAIYICLFLIALVLIFGAILALVSINRAIGYDDPTVISSEARGTMLWAAPFLLVFAIVTMGMIVTALTNKQPIFGKRGIVYGSAQYAPVYPLFMENRPNADIRPSEKGYLRAMRRFVIGVLAVTLLLTPLSLCGRNSLREDMGITVYGVFNQKTRSYEKEDIKTVTFAIYYTGGAGGGWHIRAQIMTKDGRRYDFRGDLDTLLYIKNHVPASAVRYKGEEYLNALIRSKHYTADEAAKARTLFGQ